MLLNDLINSTGIIILAIGAYIAAKGYFSDRDLNILDRTGLYFNNLEHFESMIFQKYSGIIGFILIIIGSITQLIPLTLNSTKQHIVYHTISIVYLLLFLLFIAVNYITKIISQKKIDIIYLYHSIRMIESFPKNNISQKKII